MTPRTPTTIDNIRDLLDKLRLEVKSDIRDVSTKVDGLANKVDNIDRAQAVSSTKVGILITGITVVVSAIVTIIVNRVGNKI